MDTDWAVGGEWGHAVSSCQLAIRYARSAGQQMYEYVAQIYMGLPLARLGYPDQAIAVYQACIAEAERLHVRMILGRACGYLGEVYLTAGDGPVAEAAARQGLAISEAAGPGRLHGAGSPA